MTQTRQEALAILEQGRREVRVLLRRLPQASLVEPGLDRGEWSPKDLVGHLASWEEWALEALSAWDRGERAPIDRELHDRGVDAVNADAVASKAKLTLDEVLHDAEVTHASLMDAIRAISDAAWERPATARGRKTLGHRLGQILGGPGGGFRHADAHLPGLDAFGDWRPRDPP
jgi:hypothetical protein